MKYFYDIKNELEQFQSNESVVEENVKDNDNTHQFICKNDQKFSSLMIEFVKQNKGIITVYFILLVLLPLKGVLIPHFMGQMYSNVQQKKPIKMLMYIVLALVVLLQIGWIFSEYIDLKLQPLIQKYLMDKIIHHVFRVNKENYNEQQVNVIISKISKFPSTCYNFIAQLKGVVLPSILALLVIGGYLLYADFVIGMIYWILLLLTAFLITKSLSKCDKISFECDQKTTHMFNNIDDTVKNMSTILNFEKTQDEIENISNLFENQKETCGQTFNCTLITKYYVIPLMMVFIVYCLSSFYNKLMENEIQAGMFINIIVINFLVLNTAIGLTTAFKDMIVRSGIIESSMHIFDECKIIPEYLEVEPDHHEGIQFKDVDFSRFPNQIEKRIFTKLNLHIPKNKTTLIMGKIGSGKTTLINLISKNQTILKGNIFIDGKPIYNITDLKKKVFYVPQTPILFNRTIYENICYGISEDIPREKVVEYMEKLGLKTFLDSLHDGIDSGVGLLGSNLSGGQRQMIWLMKLFFIDPEYVVMDEPTSAIDEDSKSTVYSLLQKVMENRTVIMITHDEKLRKYANVIIKMEDGKISDIEEQK